MQYRKEKIVIIINKAPENRKEVLENGFPALYDLPSRNRESLRHTNERNYQNGQKNRKQALSRKNTARRKNDKDSKRLYTEVTKYVNASIAFDLQKEKTILTL